MPGDTWGILCTSVCRGIPGESCVPQYARWYLGNPVYLNEFDTWLTRIPFNPKLHWGKGTLFTIIISSLLDIGLIGIRIIILQVLSKTKFLIILKVKCTFLNYLNDPYSHFVYQNFNPILPFGGRGVLTLFSKKKLKNGLH